MKEKKQIDWGKFRTIDKRKLWNNIEEIKQKFFKNSTWKFLISHAIPEWFSIIKVGLFIFLTRFRPAKSERKSFFSKSPKMPQETSRNIVCRIKIFQVGFLKNFCFISSMLFHNFLLLMLRNLPQSICIFFSSWKFCFYLLLMCTGIRAIICLKETDSVQFFLFTFKCCQKLEELKLENQWTKISISEATH